ncbi:MAG: hypothetical protein OWQ50_05585 [Acidianus infernus]|nr:hypothetical protein [Acidianus infernus]
MEETQLTKLKEKFVYFLINNLEEKIEETLIIKRENIEVAVLQRPMYDYFSREYKARGLLKIGSEYYSHPKYYPIEIRANKHYVTIKIKPLYSIMIPWDELEEATQKEGGNQ